MSGIEYAAGRRDDFPREWGEPPGDRFSEQRAAWVAANVAWVMAAESDPVAAVLLRDEQTMSAAKALRLTRELAARG